MKRYLNSFHGLETPFYFYDVELFRQTLEQATSANTYGYHIHYAMKANINTRILQEVRRAGLGVDCVSGNEVSLALENGFNPNHIVLAGVGKTDKEIQLGVEKEIFSFNVESLQELEVIDAIAQKNRKIQNVSIRVNPEVDAGTHHYITTGNKHNKFGVRIADLLESVDWIKSLKNIRFIGLHYHIGSQITDLKRFEELCSRVNQLQKELIKRSVPLPHINVGGGLGIDYENPDGNSIPDFATYFGLFNRFLELAQGQQVHFELGRSLVGQCGTLISRVLYTKSNGDIDFLILDAGMTELMRPALYQATHKLENLTGDQSLTAKYDVAGPICESSDFFGKDIEMTLARRGDLVAIRSAGAYGETMRNHYNAREYAKAYYSDSLS